MQNIFTDAIFADFEAAHPGVQIMVVPVSVDERTLPVPQTTDAVPGFVEQAHGFASRADVLFVDSSTLSAEFLRTGALLNLAPLLAADSNAAEADFVPVLLDSFRWDGALWGLPIGASLGFLLYDQRAFDAAGLSYPNDRWTLNDFIHASNILSAVAQSGKIASGMIWLDPSILLRSLAGRGIAQTKTNPPLPILDDPHLADQLESWLPLYQAGQQ
ncbi:MAG: ABC transporter substrate-binding protein, partial [Anaerolineae bacterium]|nr:ABC transporter substrate-binding protein [Anaerolineae bacterium]